jgi:hypothetical protein
MLAYAYSIAVELDPWRLPQLKFRAELYLTPSASRTAMIDVPKNL